MIEVIIIDDESLAREIIRTYLASHSDIRVIGEFENGFDGLKAIRELRPDLIFLDIQMPKINGFELLELIEEPPQIIFSTAYDQYAIKAFENNAVDYLLKPYTKERFDQALDRVRQRLSQGKTTQPDIAQLASEAIHEPLSRIVVRMGAKIQVIDIEAIEYFQATDDYVEIHCTQGKFLKQITMKYLDTSLPNGKFVRVHRSYIISTDRLNKIEHFEKDAYLAIMKSGDKLPISRSGYGRLREMLKF